MSTTEWLVVTAAAVPLASAIGVLLTWSLWRDRQDGPWLVPALLALHGGLVVLGGTVATAAAVRSWQLVDDGREQASSSLLEVSRIDGDASLYKLLVLVLVAATALLGLLLSMTARFAASVRPVDRAIACAVIGLEIGVSGLGLVYLAGGSRHPVALLAVAHLPVLIGAMVICWPPHAAAEREPRPRPAARHDAGGESWVGQCCIRVRDVDGSVAFYEALGLRCTSRTEIPQAFEAIVENPAGGGALQLAEMKEPPTPFALGTALWKLYVNTDDAATTWARALAAGATVDTPLERLERWPVTIGFVRDPDGHLLEIVERHPWPAGAPTGGPWVGQSCINVSDLDAAVARYEALGLRCTSRTEIAQALEAIVEHPERGGKLQLAQQREAPDRIEMGALWKLYVHTDDCRALHDRAVTAGWTSAVAPMRLEAWPVTIAFLTDPDGYQVELVERHRDPSELERRTPHLVADGDDRRVGQ